MHILILSAETRASIARVRDFSETAQHVNVIADVMSGKIPPPGDIPEHVLEVPDGYRVVYSVDLDAEGNLWRHLSVSCSDKLPNPHLVMELCKEFGFDHRKMILQLQGKIAHAVEEMVIH